MNSLQYTWLLTTDIWFSFSSDFLVFLVFLVFVDATSPFSTLFFFFTVLVVVVVEKDSDTVFWKMDPLCELNAKIRFLNKLIEIFLRCNLLVIAFTL